MKLISIEPTPNPNSMKLNLDESLAAGVSHTYTTEDRDGRRTAGDALSDLGCALAIGPMAKALADPSKLVRWRAARFLFETGDASALAALHECENDPEFEVRMQVRLAIERIQGGQTGQGPIWRQMTR